MRRRCKTREHGRATTGAASVGRGETATDRVSEQAVDSPIYAADRPFFNCCGGRVQTGLT
jgi:hypothetical protein